MRLKSVWFARRSGAAGQREPGIWEGRGFVGPVAKRSAAHPSPPGIRHPLVHHHLLFLSHPKPTNTLLTT